MLYSIFVPKLVAVVTSLCPMCMGVSQMNCPMAQTLSQNQTVHGCVAYNWSYGHFVIYLAYFGHNLLPWQRPLDSCSQKCLLWIGRRRKPPVISSPILVISCRNACAFIAIFVEKLVAMVTPLCPLCTAVSQMNSPMAQTLLQNQTVHGCVAYNWSYGHFCDFWPILVKIW